MSVIRYAPCLLLAAACSSDPVVEEVRLDGAPDLVPGRHATIEEVPVGISPAFSPARPLERALPNGVTLLLLPDRSRPVVELELRARVGSYSDPVGLEGTAEMMAGLMREGGSAAWPGDRVDAELDARGASIDFDAGPRALTGRFECLSEDLEAVLAVFADLALNPAFPEAELERIRARMISEVAQREDDAGSMADREARRAFYGAEDPRVRRQEVAGLEALSRADLAAFHAERFGCRRAQIAVHGDFEPEAMVAALGEAFGGWEPQSATPVAVPLEAPAPAQRRVVLLPREGAEQAELRLVLEGVRRNHPDYPALELGSYVFGIGGFGNRMIRRVRSELGLAYNTGAFWMPGWEQQGLFWATCGTKNETAALALREMVGVLEGYLAEGAGEEEFEHARRRLLNAKVFEIDRGSKVLARIADLEWNGYPWNHPDQVVAAIRELSAEDVLAACRRHLDSGRLTLFVAGDPARFDADLSEFGEVEVWDASAPEPAAGGGEDEAAAAARGAELAAHLLSSHGGQAAWEAVGATRSTLRQEHVTPMEAVLVYPGRLHVRAAGEGGRVMSVLTEGAGWRRGDGGFRELDPAEVAAEQRDLSAKLPLVLMRLARGDYEVAAVGENLLLLTDETGFELRLELHDHGLCRAIEIGGDTVVRYEFHAYGLVGGVMLPGEVVWSSGEEQARVRFDWEVNPEVRAGWFERPVGD